MKKIPLCIPAIGEEEINEVTKVLKSGWYAVGPKNREFEDLFKDLLGVRYAISMNSCTSCLQLALECQNITKEVIVPSFTFVASANAIVTAGAKPVFVDIKYDTCCIDPDKIEDAITENTEAIMVVHFGGQTADMTRIMEIANKYELKVIEDSAETIGGLHYNKQAGSFATGCFSFFPTKNITTGEGGLLTTNDAALAEKVKALVGHGISKSTHQREKDDNPWTRSAQFAGYNFRLSNILAAIGVEQIKKLKEFNDQRRINANYYNEKLARFEEIDIPVEIKKNYHVYQMYTIKLNGINRNQFVHYLNENDIGASVHFDPPVHLQDYYLGTDFKKYDLSITEKVAKSIVTLPMYPSLSFEEIDYIIEEIDKAISVYKI